MLVSGTYQFVNNRISSASERPGGKIQQNACLAKTAVYSRQSKELGQLYPTANLCVNSASPPFRRKDIFLVSASATSPVRTAIDRSTALHPDTNIVTSPVVLRQSILAQLATIHTKVSVALEQQQTGYNRYFDRKVKSLPTYKICKMLYVNRPPLVILPANRQTSARYYKLMPHTLRPFKWLEV